MQDHGGDLDRAIAQFGGEAADWIDLSTGINRAPWPLPPLPVSATAALPTRALADEALAAARAAYGTSAPGLALSGAQAAIQLAPRLRPPGRVRILGPTYTEHAAAFAAEGWQVETVDTLAALAQAEAAVIVNPNNPDGRSHSPAAITALAPTPGLLIVDESFADPTPALSLAPSLPLPGALVLRSFGKFYGRAGLRLGFVFGAAQDIARLAALAGPWAVSGPALTYGALALKDSAWRAAAIARLGQAAARLDGLARARGWVPAGGTALFRLYEVDDAGDWQARLAKARIWTRSFGYAPRWLRLGLPGSEREWTRLAAALGQG